MKIGGVLTPIYYSTQYFLCFEVLWAVVSTVSVLVLKEATATTLKPRVQELKRFLS